MFLRQTIFWSLALGPRQYCNVRYPTGFKPAITLVRSNQIASNSVCRYRGPIPIDLYCSLIFMTSITEIQLNKVRPLFPLDSRQRFWQIAMYGEAVVISLARIERDKVHVVFWSLALGPRQYCNVRYPTGFKPAITLVRSNQIASNSVCRYRGPIPIDLYCSLIFMTSITEIQLNKVRPLFPLNSRQRFWQIASRSMYGEQVKDSKM